MSATDAPEPTELRIPAPCLVVLVGPAGSGKSTWAQANFQSTQIVSSDDLRSVVGRDRDDQEASEDAFRLLDDIVEARLRRRLVTVVDTTGLNEDRRKQYRERAAEHDIACFAVGFDVDAKLLRSRNKERHRPIPTKVLSSQIVRWEQAREVLDLEGFAAVHEPGQVALVPPAHVEAMELADRQREHPLRLRFGLQISSFDWPGAPELTAEHLATIAASAEEAGFSSIWVMDHFRQIPQVGPEWHDMMESYTTLAYLAAMTATARLGVLVTGIGYRNPAHLGKIIATLDVLSGGRAVCGLGIGWFEKEAAAYGWPFPAVPERYDLLEDTLELLPKLWGPGAPSFEGRTISVPEAMCYPRPLQEHIPILIGGSGEKRTLRLVAAHADMCNLFGDPSQVQHKLEVLHGHCAELDRDPGEIEVTTLQTALTARDRSALETSVAALRTRNRTHEDAATALGAGTVEDQVGRFRAFAEVGVDSVIVTVPNLAGADALAPMADVISAFAH